ncbi:MAG: hypothetical protein WKG01_10130 [Kofleriaceae bacterium]
MAKPSWVRDGAERVWNAICAAPPWLVLGSGWLFLIVYAHPGLMTQDSYDHLREVREGIYTDSHPPAINVIWSVIEYVTAGPVGFLVLQATCLIGGLYRVFRITFEPRRAAWFATGVFVFPPVMLPMAVIWKDCLMAGFLVVGVALLCSPRRGARIGGLVMMFLATAVRYNAFGATLPLIWFLFEWTPGWRWWKRYPLALAAWFAVTFAAFFLNARVTDHQMHYWHSSLALFDIAGTLANLDQDLPDDQLQTLLAGTEIQATHDIHASFRALYNPRSFLPLVWPDRYPPMWKVPINGYVPAPVAQRDAIERAWKQVLHDHPREYLVHRFVVFGHALGFSREQSDAGIVGRRVMWPEFAGKLGIGLESSKLQRKLTRPMVWLRDHTPIFTPWLYVVLSLILLPLGWRHRDVRALLISGLVIESSLLPLAQSPDYRYSHWMVICTVISVIVLTARRARNRENTDRVPPAP